MLGGLDWGHIRCCGSGCFWFRPYGGSLSKSAKVTKALLPLSIGASPRLGMPSLRHCSGGPPPSAIHGRGRLPRHPCRGAHCAEPPLGLSTGQIKIKSQIKSKSRSLSFWITRIPVGAGLLAITVGQARRYRLNGAIASKPAPTRNARNLELFHVARRSAETPKHVYSGVGQQPPAKNHTDP